MYQEAGSLDVACPCDPISSMTRAFVLRISLDAEDSVGFRIDVKDVYEHFNIYDMRGVPVSLGSSLWSHCDLPITSPAKHLHGCQHGVLAQCSAGRCVVPPRSVSACFSEGVTERTGKMSLWSQLSGACVPGPDLFEETSAGEVLVR